MSVQGSPGQKRRPALVVSLDGFDPEDLVLCVITSRIPGRASPREVLLQAQDLTDGLLPRPSVVKVGKLFTVHQGLIVGRFGRIRPQKLADVLRALQLLFQPDRASP